MADKDVQVWREGSSGEPKFPDKFKVLQKAVLQVTDIQTNRNKYYAIELHEAGNKYRVYTHYGRTDDLDSNPDAGIRECRYPVNLIHAQNLYDKIYKEKTSARKGYKELNLASSKIGSKQTVGQSSGEVDDKTLKKLAKVTATKDTLPVVVVPKEVQKLVTHLYSEATKTLTKTVNATITANGIETPLGVLTIGQIDKGESILLDITTSFKKKNSSELTRLSGEFYTVIPHKFGRSKSDALEAVIDTTAKIKQKQDTLQLMRDMLNVSGKGVNILANPQVEKQYLALGCEIGCLDKNGQEFKKIKGYTTKSKKYSSFIIKNIFTIKRPNEHASYIGDNVGNMKLLFHGSSAHNWVGILSRGLMLPKAVTKLGVQRTDQGWLGHGIYFGDSIDTALGYASSGKLDSTFVAIAKVALGKIKEYKKITYGLDRPPTGYDSCHGNPKGHSEFDDHEFVIYDTAQQRLEYLLELD